MVNAGVPAEMRNPFTNDTTSAPVVTVTVRLPDGAFAAIETFAVRAVALATVTLLTVTPTPKLTWLVACEKLVSWPVIEINRF